MSRRRRLTGYNSPSKQPGGVLGRTRELDNAERKAASRIRAVSRNRGSRSLYGTPHRSGGRHRLRTPFRSGKFNMDVDDNEVASRYQQIMDIYARGKINTKNAWRLKLVENIERMISLEAHGNFKKCSATIAAATQIYHYRVDDVYTKTFKMLSNFGGPDGSTDVNSVKRKKRVNVKTLLSQPATTMDMRQVISMVDPMFHKTTSAFDEGGSRGLLMNNLSVHNGCDIVFDSTMVVTAGPRKDRKEKIACLNVEVGAGKEEKEMSEEEQVNAMAGEGQKDVMPEDKPDLITGKEGNPMTEEGQVNAMSEMEVKEMEEDVADSDEEHSSWVSKLSKRHKVHRFQARDICPGIKHLTAEISKVEEAVKKHVDITPDCIENAPKRLNFADLNETMDFTNVKDTEAPVGSPFSAEQQQANMFLESDTFQEDDYFVNSSRNKSLEVTEIGDPPANPSIPHGDYSVYVESDPRVSEVWKENYLFHPDILNCWAGPER